MSWSSQLSQDLLSLGLWKLDTEAIETIVRRLPPGVRQKMVPKIASTLSPSMKWFLLPKSDYAQCCDSTTELDVKHLERVIHPNHTSDWEVLNVAALLENGEDKLEEPQSDANIESKYFSNSPEESKHSRKRLKVYEVISETDSKRDAEVLTSAPNQFLADKLRRMLKDQVTQQFIANFRKNFKIPFFNELQLEPETLKALGYSTLAAITIHLILSTGARKFSARWTKFLVELGIFGIGWGGLVGLITLPNVPTDPLYPKWSLKQKRTQKAGLVIMSVGLWMVWLTKRRLKS